MPIASFISYQMSTKVFLWVPYSTRHVTLSMTRHPSKKRFLGDSGPVVMQRAVLPAEICFLRDSDPGWPLHLSESANQ